MRAGAIEDDIVSNCDRLSKDDSSAATECNDPALSNGRSPHAETFARLLLERWGVVFRDLIARESLAPAWRDLLVALRRMEARGEVRGGRFVSGFVGEQFARPEAIDLLRAVRRNGADAPLRIAAADPLNLVGIITPGSRVSPLSGEIVEVLAPADTLAHVGKQA